MKKKGILLIAVILLSTAGLVQAEEGVLSGTIDVTYLSRYIWRGFDMYDNNHSAIQPSIDLDLYGTGLGVKILWSRANKSGFEDNEWLNYTLYYNNSLFEAQNYATDYTVGWGYYSYPDSPKNASDLQEFFATLSWPEICPTGVVPSYTIIRMYEAESNSAVSGAGGWIHIFGLGYDLTVLEIAAQPLHLSAAAVYNGGAFKSNVDNDWSHAVFGVSTGIDLGNNLTFTPGVYYQSSWEDSVNSSDEYWCSLGLSYKF